MPEQPSPSLVEIVVKIPRRKPRKPKPQPK
jgi:hypothetical protein